MATKEKEVSMATKEKEVSMATKEKKEKKLKIQKFSKRAKLILLLVFFIGVMLTAATYAWFSASLNVKVKFFDVKVSTETGLFISLDGVNFSDTVEITHDSIITDLRELYPNHTNQWANSGLWSVSSNGIPNPNSDKFAVYYGSMGKYKDKPRRGLRYVKTTLVSEDYASEWSEYVAFDIFLKLDDATSKPIYLTANSDVTANGTDKGIKNASSSGKLLIFLKLSLHAHQPFSAKAVGAIAHHK